jgi:mannosyltransferase OCH1-like enzyme
MAENIIPKTLHFIWVGDESKRPDNCINTWRNFHPEWDIKVWGNDSLIENEWVNARHMHEMSLRELNGVADMMRWEILYNEGGIVIDADSMCLMPLNEKFLESDCFCCWENELVRPGLMAAGYFGSIKENEFVGQMILDINHENTVINEMAWITVGPLRLTKSKEKYNYNKIKIYPSHYFIPEHFTGVKYDGNGPVYAHQFWGSTKKIYGHLHTL